MPIYNTKAYSAKGIYKRNTRKDHCSMARDTVCNLAIVDIYHLCRARAPIPPLPSRLQTPM